MGTSVTYCKGCGACNWAFRECCEDCGGELEPTFRQVYAYYTKLLLIKREAKNEGDERAIT